MKKLCFVWAVAVLLLAGCGAPADFETMADEYTPGEVAAPQQTGMILDREAVSIGGDSGMDRIYLCDDFCVMVQTFSAGDLDETIRSVTGYQKEKLTVLEHRSQGVTGYECVWVSAGEGGDQVGRFLILDDGAHHYTISVMADAEKAGELTDTWQLLLNSFTIGLPETTKG
jgi:hypothetical protein